MHRHCMHCHDIISMYQPNMMLVTPDAMSIGSSDKAIDLEGLFEVGRYCYLCLPEAFANMREHNAGCYEHEQSRMLACHGDTVLDSCPDLVCTIEYEPFVP